MTTRDSSLCNASLYNASLYNAGDTEAVGYGCRK